MGTCGTYLREVVQLMHPKGQSGACDARLMCRCLADENDKHTCTNTNEPRRGIRVRRGMDGEGEGAETGLGRFRMRTRQTEGEGGRRAERSRGTKGADGAGGWKKGEEQNKHRGRGWGLAPRAWCRTTVR